MPNATDRTTKVAKSFGGGAKSSNETPVSSAEHANPIDDGTGNTPATRPHPAGAKVMAGKNPPMSTDQDPDRT